MICGLVLPRREMDFDEFLDELLEGIISKLGDRESRVSHLLCRPASIRSIRHTYDFFDVDPTESINSKIPRVAEELGETNNN